MTNTVHAMAIVCMLAFIDGIYAAPLTDAQIADQIIKASRTAYLATGHPCACPYDHARNGSICGGRSAYSRPGGAEPKCYPKDVKPADIAGYRAQHH
jgi:hypothetical protein